ncbi:fibroblast growth factor receptor substrate 2-like [Branchiostoma floridae]|uniref:Fibroblast growth factor receptor substrate 2-like n=1 Tax=Branchiostoma floridae TaxID=7739 RepID=A0A9J7N0D2_BRAFL|nr:fibroblast growth factor receptor substrate 2-like [Branchiostoma floridae]
MDIIFQGELDKWESMKQEWRRRFCVLKSMSSTGNAFMEFYRDVRTWQHEDPKAVVNLLINYEVYKVPDPRKRFCFEVRSMDKVIRLSVDNIDIMEKWLFHLDVDIRANMRATSVHVQANECQGVTYVVKPYKDCDELKKLSATGELFLQITSSEITLYHRLNGEEITFWPLTCLRRYSSSSGTFTFECGRKSPCGEGIYTFVSKEYDAIFSVLDEFVKKKVEKLRQDQPPPQYDEIERGESGISAPPSYDTLVHIGAFRKPQETAASEPPQNYDHAVLTRPPTRATEGGAGESYDLLTREFGQRSRGPRPPPNTPGGEGAAQGEEPIYDNKNCIPPDEDEALTDLYKHLEEKEMGTAAQGAASAGQPGPPAYRRHPDKSDYQSAIIRKSSVVAENQPGALLGAAGGVPNGAAEKPPPVNGTVMLPPQREESLYDRKLPGQPDTTPGRRVSIETSSPAHPPALSPHPTKGLGKFQSETNMNTPGKEETEKKHKKKPSLAKRLSKLSLYDKSGDKEIKEELNPAQ